jgi:hypothetical protein
VFTMLRCMERHYQKNEDGNGTAWRIQRIWEKVIFVPYPSWLLNLLNCKLNHLKLQKILIMWKLLIWTSWLNKSMIRLPLVLINEGFTDSP